MRVKRIGKIRGLICHLIAYFNPRHIGVNKYLCMIRIKDYYLLRNSIYA